MTFWRHAEYRLYGFAVKVQGPLNHKIPGFLQRLLVFQQGCGHFASLPLQEDSLKGALNSSEVAALASFGKASAIRFSAE
jgi:hypothetical protein